MKGKFNILYWFIASIIMLLVFGFRAGSLITAFYFISFLLPIALITSWYFNTYLIPYCLLRKKYGRFIILSLFTLILSLDIIMIIVFISFILISKYQPDQLDTLLLHYRSFPVVLYLAIIVNAFFNLVLDYLEMAEDMKNLSSKLNSGLTDGLTIRSERQNRKIVYDSIVFIESMSDYIVIRTVDDQKIITRERISRIEQKLPSEFIRVHRSFIVNIEKIISFSREHISVEGMDIPISRTYKKDVLGRLKMADDQ
ncbi:MAG: LytTR family transcriptional regulator DNA-binding domain-containing protein [Bacteroidales bacterium]|nr:LytTR family transcriptional regulator DNA-binding domain-containing protein [Bacteroidales bacterium]